MIRRAVSICSIVALIASSSWSHAFLTPKNHLLYPDVEADRALYRARWLRADIGRLVRESSRLLGCGGGSRLAAQQCRRDEGEDQSHRQRLIGWMPIITRAPRTFMPGTTLRASPPAATRVAVSRADERPPPR